MAQRGRNGGQTARDVPIPLPVRGLMSDALTAESNGQFAGEFFNWKSKGSTIRLRSSYSVGDETGIIQRLPFEFGAMAETITVTNIGLSSSGATIARPSGEGSIAYISSQAIFADGRGNPVLFDGEAFTAATFITTTGKSQADFDGVIAHHDRPYFWDKDGALEFYYGDVGAVTGELIRFPLDRLGSVTGRIAAILSLTVDAGHGMNDTLCIITTTGQLVLYEGLDPGDAADWRLLSRVQGPVPVPGYPFAAIGSDVWMVTKTGVVSISEAIRSGIMAQNSPITRPIANLLLDEIDDPDAYWSLHCTADGSTVYINKVEGLVARQWVYDLVTGTWSTADYPARSWFRIGGKSMMVTVDGAIGEVTRGNTNGEVITARLKTGWLRAPGAGMTYLKPTIKAKGPIQATVRVLSDHDATESDNADSTQTVTLFADGPADLGGRVALNDIIALDAVGDVFRLEIDITAPDAEIVSLYVGVQ